MAGSEPAMAGMEVPIMGSDSVNWIEVSVPATSSSSPSHVAPSSSPSSAETLAPPPRDAASCFVVGDPPTYLIWRTEKSAPHVLEILELSACKEFPRVGLRIVFPDVICPFAFICRSEIEHVSKKLYLLYALSVSGVAYLFKLESFAHYAACSVFPLSDFSVFNLQDYSGHGTITSVAASLGCLVIGRSDGSVGCFQLGKLDQSEPGFGHELWDDSGISRLWGLMSRNKSVGAVQDLLILKFEGKEFVFVLHFNGILRVWDLFDHGRVFSQTLSTAMPAGATFRRLWVGGVNHETNIIPLAILYRESSDVSLEMISVYSFHFRTSDRISFVLEPLMQNISLEEGQLINVNFTSNKILLLIENGLISYNLFHSDGLMEDAHRYALQEAFVADQLFQNSEHSLDDLFWIINSMRCSVKDQAASFISSIFLRRLLHPGVHHKIVMRATFQDFNKHWTDSEFQSLTVDGLKKEILLLMEHEGFRGSFMSIFRRWKVFCTRYFENWCKKNAPYGFLVDSSTGAFGLIRRNCLSVFRSLEDIELLLHGSVNLHNIMSSSIDFSDLEWEILLEVQQCLSSISHQLGKAASAIFYESLVSMPNRVTEDVIPCLLKVLETGYSPSPEELRVSNLGVDIAWEKGLADHKNIRKFSINLALSFHFLHNKATTWEGVLNIVQCYLKILMPRKITQNLDSEVILNSKTSVLVQATSQVAEVMFESALSVLLLLRYLVKNSVQIHMHPDNILCIQNEMVPLVEEIVTDWLLTHLFGVTPCESLVIEDFSSQLSSLQIDSSSGKKSWKERLGKFGVVLASMLLLNCGTSSGEHTLLSSKCLPNPQNIIASVRCFSSWIIWGTADEESSAFSSRATQIASILLKNGQYDAVEIFLCIVDAHLQKEKVSECIQDNDSEWCTHLHLLGCCFLAQAHYRLRGPSKEKKLSDAVRCFFRASSGQGAFQALQRLLNGIGLPPLDDFSDCASAAAWRLCYYQWTMQIFEQYSFNEGACQFALAALEQVDEAFCAKTDSDGVDHSEESAVTVKGQLWANVFKFSLDLNNFNDAYCAIISNPDEESKYICLRRFTIVLYERGALKFLCAGELPFIGLTEQTVQELSWKAERSDLSAKPNAHKLLYAFEMHHHNWRRAARNIYHYSAHLKTEAALKEKLHRSVALQERLNGLSAAINALHLLHPTYAWIDSLQDGISLEAEHYHSKKSKKSVDEHLVKDGVQLQSLQYSVDIERLEKEFILSSAEHLLSLANIKWTFDGIQNVPSDLVDLLVQMNYYDMAFTVLLKFWKGSRLKRELEKVFVAMSLKCCPNTMDLLVGNDINSQSLLLTSTKCDAYGHASLHACSPPQQPTGDSQWETLELYLEKYKEFHPMLPVIVAETLLATDAQIELPLWLVNRLKANRGENMFGMMGKESNTASLFRLYVDYGRYAEATSLMLDYIDGYTLERSIRRKKPSAVWFPYTAIERLWCQLEELITSGHSVDHFQNLQRQLRGALLRHLELLKVDSQDAMS